MPGPTRHEFTEQHRLNVISPAQLTANTDNWSPTGLSTATIIRASTDASRNLTGIVAPALARLLILENIGAQDLVLKHDVTSTAANRFYCPDNTDLTLPQNSWTWLVYDVTSTRWRVLGAGASIPAGTYVLTIEGGQETINARGSVTGAQTIDPTLGNIVTFTMTGDTTATIAAPVGSGGSSLEWWVTQDGTGGHALTVAATGGTVTDDGTITPDTTAGVTVRYILERVPGTSNDWIRNIVGGGMSFATPAIVLGTAAAAGAATTTIRSDSTIVAFDTTVPVTQAFGDSAATGSAAVAARRDHKHGMPSTPTGSGGPLLITDTPAGSPLVFADLLQTEEGDDLLYGDTWG